jgi:hypothetical protein
LIAPRGTDGSSPASSSGELCKPSVLSKSTALCISFYGWNKADLFIDALRSVGFPRYRAPCHPQEIPFRGTKMTSLLMVTTAPRSRVDRNEQ